MIFTVRNGSSGSTPVKPNWNENNALSPDYIANRPMYYRDETLATQTLFDVTPMSDLDGDALAVSMTRDLFVSYESGGLSDYTRYTITVRDGNTAYTDVCIGPTDVRSEEIEFTASIIEDVISVGDKYSDYRDGATEAFYKGYCIVNNVVYITDESLFETTFGLQSGTDLSNLTIECSLYGPLLPVTVPRELLPSISEDIHDIHVVKVNSIDDLSGIDFTHFQANDLVLVASGSSTPMTWVVDNQMSDTSENPVQNKVLYQQLQNVQAQSIAYTTTAPTEINTDGLKFVVLSAEPATRYDGWVYIITN